MRVAGEVVGAVGVGLVALGGVGHAHMEIAMVADGPVTIRLERATGAAGGAAPPSATPSTSPA